MVDRQSSPYFDKRRKLAPSPHSGSSYFVRSPSSAWGSTSSLQSLLFCLTTASKPECSDSKDGHPRNSRCCAECAAAVDDATSHFQRCGEFQRRWERLSMDIDTDECFKRAEQHLDQSVRHLCAHRCYMRAFAPCRDWLLLRKTIHEVADATVESLLAGWRCVLKSDAEATSLPRTVFLGPDGQSFSTTRQVLQHLGITKAAIDAEGAYTWRCQSHISSTSSPTFLALDCRSKCSLQSLQFARVETPLGLLEELFGDDPWRLLLSAILLNRTTRVQVDTIMKLFLDEWPTAQAAANANADRMAAVIRPLGIRYRRSAGIIRFSREYLTLLESKDVEKTSLPRDLSVDTSRNVAWNLSKCDILNLWYCGMYAWSAYALFIRRDSSIDPADHALKAYAEYQRGVESVAGKPRTVSARKMLQYNSI